MSVPKDDPSLVPTLDFKWVILFDNKLMIADEGPENSTETNI